MPSKTSTAMQQAMPSKLRLKLANECESILGLAKLSSMRKEFKFSIIHPKHATDRIYTMMMDLFEQLMRGMYERSSWGWNKEEKLAEWKHSRTRIILVTKKDVCDPMRNVVENELPDEESGDSIIGFMCFRFEKGADLSETALYVYELHIREDHQRQGLGEELMRLARALGLEFKMDKVMLTVFRFNESAVQFYNKLKFCADKCSPAKTECDYVIMSQRLKKAGGGRGGGGIG